MPDKKHGTKFCCPTCKAAQPEALRLRNMKDFVAMDGPDPTTPGSDLGILQEGVAPSAHDPAAAQAEADPPEPQAASMEVEAAPSTAAEEPFWAAQAETPATTVDFFAEPDATPPTAAAQATLDATPPKAAAQATGVAQAKGSIYRPEAPKEVGIGGVPSFPADTVLCGDCDGVVVKSSARLYFKTKDRTVYRCLCCRRKISFLYRQFGS